MSGDLVLDDFDEAQQRLSALSEWVDAHNAGRDPEAILWSRITKVCEEAGEAQSALRGAIGENPRKGVTHTMDDVVAELLDTAIAALAAVEHVRGHDRTALMLLVQKVETVHERAIGVADFADECAAGLAPGRAAVYLDLSNRVRAAVAGPQRAHGGDGGQ